MPRCFLPLLVLLIVAGIGTVIAGMPASQKNGSFQPGKLSEAEEKTLQPGLTLRFFAGDQANLMSDDARIVRLAALHVPEGTPHSTLQPARRFRAQLTGFLKLKLNGEYAFKMVGTGDAEWLVNGRAVIAMQNGIAKESGLVEMVQGANSVEIRYASPPQGDASVRVYWKSDDFSWEPLPPADLFTRGDLADLHAGLAVREGRLLFATLGCARCHGLPGGLTPDKCQMPELQQTAPALHNAGHRFGAEWLQRWIADPQSVRPETAMPRLLHGDGVAQQAADLTAYILGLKTGKPFAESRKNDELTEDGDKLFLQLGCVACHHVNEPQAKDEFKRMSLHHVVAKFAPGALHAFLRAPQEHYSWSRMPDFKLNAEETTAVTSYLLTEAKGNFGVGKSLEGDAKRGGELFKSVGCVQCHTTPDNAALPRPTLAFPRDFNQGCLAADANRQGKAPQFRLTGDQKTALRAFLGTDGSSLTREVPAEFSLRQVKLLQCNACHHRDGRSSRWYPVLTQHGAGLQPEYLPHLTWTGEKLHPEWTSKLLAGQHDHRARPWLKARMPAFPTRAEMLAHGLSHEHGFALKEDPRPAPDAKLAEIGTSLLPQAGGFNCINCHGVGVKPAVEPFGSEGINLLDAALRLRYDYYSRWMLDPQRVDGTAKMTKFTIDGGRKTAIVNVFDGDAQRQFDAIWQGMQALREKER